MIGLFSFRYTISSQTRIDTGSETISALSFVTLVNSTILSSCSRPGICQTTMASHRLANGEVRLYLRLTSPP